jgi:hypothetical protein
MHLGKVEKVLIVLVIIVVDRKGVEVEVVDIGEEPSQLLKETIAMLGDDEVHHSSRDTRERWRYFLLQVPPRELERIIRRVLRKVRRWI